jgi:hypothetical protein
MDANDDAVTIADSPTDESNDDTTTSHTTTTGMSTTETCTGVDTDPTNTDLPPPSSTGVGGNDSAHHGVNTDDSFSDTCNAMACTH